MEKNYGEVAGLLVHIQKLIPILRDMEFDDFHLFYEDCDIWVLQWHNPLHDGMEWMLREVET